VAHPKGADVKLLTFFAGSGQRVGALVGEQVVDVTAAYAAALAAERHPRAAAVAAAVLPPSMREILQGGEVALDAVRRAVRHVEEHGRGEARLTAPGGVRIAYPPGEVRVGPPVPDPRKIVCIGLNYRDHCEEQGIELPKVLMTFPKFADAVVGPGEPIILPRGCEQLDWEVELTVIMGRRARYLDPGEALGAVAGYTVGNDVSARDFQFADKQVMRGKACESFAPMGPYLTLAGAVPDPHALKIESRLNGKVMQSSNTGNLIHRIPAILAWVTRYLTLEPGDCVMTGTPAGVGVFRKPPVFMKPGDVIEMEIEGLGVLRNPVVASE
jgi:acylpyruvate hydrolase